MIGIIGTGAGGVALAKYFEDRGSKTIVWFHSQEKYRLFKSQNNVIISKDITGESTSHSRIITDITGFADRGEPAGADDRLDAGESGGLPSSTTAAKNCDPVASTDAEGAGDSAVSTNKTDTSGSGAGKQTSQKKCLENKITEKKNATTADSKINRTTITRITDSLEELIQCAQYIFIVTPARVHEEIAFLLEDLLDPDYHVIILYPGRTYGSLAFYNNMRFKFDKIYEAQTILHACRLEYNNLIIRGRKEFVYYSTPFTAIQEQLDFIEKIFPDLKFNEDYPGTTLNNMGALLHPIPLVLNGTRVESGEEFDFYSDGLTNKVIDYIYKVQAEKKAVMRKLKCNYIPLYRWLNMMYNVDGANLKKSVNKIKAYRGLAAPKTLNHRYIFDDIITGLVPLYYTARNLGIEADALGSFINFASTYMDKDFMQVGRRDLYSKYLSGTDNWLK